jgi:hypothetical protein
VLGEAPPSAPGQPASGLEPPEPEELLDDGPPLAPEELLLDEGPPPAPAAPPEPWPVAPLPADAPRSLRLLQVSAKSASAAGTRREWERIESSPGGRDGGRKARAITP